MRKLSNDELATRTREANRRRGERHRERLTIAGRAALTVWVPVGLRSRFVNEAAASGVNINELATQLIDRGLRESKTAIIADMPDPQPETHTPVFVADASTHNTVSVSLDRSAMMTTIGELLDAGLTGNEIARRLNAAGYRSTKGSALIGANVLREYRTWREKKDGSDSTAV